MANMWTNLNISVILFAIRLYFALQPSYIHPDENFQGPEVIAGHVFAFPFAKTWEFTSSHPIRSVFPLWPVYGLPMTVLRWFSHGLSSAEPTPRAVYYTLRITMFMLSVVLENWAIHELVPPRRRKIAGLLVASSYVTWTYQAHTFSNSVETLIVLWSLVFIQRIGEEAKSPRRVASVLLGILAVYGVFNRITYPAFVLLPGLGLVKHFLRYPLSFLFFFFSALLAILVAQITDASFYSNPLEPQNVTSFVPTPLSSLAYNLDPDNLATHGTHMRLTHLLVNLPMLLLPALPFLRPTHLSQTALAATVILSLFSHQEPRFLLPAVPLFLTSLSLPRRKNFRYSFLASWVLFNILLGTLFGIFHQGGVVPMQLKLGELRYADQLGDVNGILWWRTYSPPVWLFGGRRSFLLRLAENSFNLHGTAENSNPPTIDLMGLPFAELKTHIERNLTECGIWKSFWSGVGMPNAVVLVAPYSSLELDRWIAEEEVKGGVRAAPVTKGVGVVPGATAVGQKVGEHWLRWEEVWFERRHLNLDDIGDDEGDFGLPATWGRVVGRRGLKAWRITRVCG